MPGPMDASNTLAPNYTLPKPVNNVSNELAPNYTTQRQVGLGGAQPLPGQANTAGSLGQFEQRMSSLPGQAAAPGGASNTNPSYSAGGESFDSSGRRFMPSDPSFYGR